MGVSGREWRQNNTAIRDLQVCLRKPYLGGEVTLAADTNEPDHSTFVLGAAVEVTFTATGLTGPTNLSAAIYDENGDLVEDLGMVVLSYLNGYSHTFDCPSSSYGYFEVRARLTDGTTNPALGSRPAGIITYAVVPDPAERTVYAASKTRFGLQGGFNANVNVMPLLGARWFIQGGHWRTLEPNSAGEFTGTLPTSVVESLTWNGEDYLTYAMISPVRSVPDWAQEPGTGGSVNTDMTEMNATGETNYPDFMTAIATAMAAKYPSQDLRIYQGTWEPQEPWGYGGSDAELVKFYSLVYDEVHAADSNAMVVGPCLYLYDTATAQLTDLITAGLVDYMDGYSIHPYTSAYPPESNELPTNLETQLTALDTAFGGTIPFLGTEQGERYNDVGNLNKARNDVRAPMIMLGKGAILDFGFYLHDFWSVGSDWENDPQSFGFYWNLNFTYNFGTDKLGPKAIVPAYAHMTWRLDGSTAQGAASGLTGTQLGYVFTRGSETITVIWDYADETSYSIDPTAIVYDLMGNEVSHSGSITLTASPQYVVETT